MKMRRNFLQRMHLIHSIGPKTLVFGRFQPFRYCTKVDEKMAELAPWTNKFTKQSYVGSFHNERNRSTPQDPKLMFFERFWPFHYCTKVDAKLAELAPLTYKFAKRSCVGTFRNQGTQSTPLDPKLIFWHVSDRSILHESRCKIGQTKAIDS
jgi:hypothetical protein